VTQMQLSRNEDRSAPHQGEDVGVFAFAPCR